MIVVFLIRLIGLGIVVMIGFYLWKNPLYDERSFHIKINLLSGKALTILGGILILIAISMPMQLAEEFCVESGPGIEENKCYFELLDRYLSCKETQDRYGSDFGFTKSVYSCSTSGWNSWPTAIYSGIAGGLLVIYGVLGKEKDGQRFSIPVIILSALIMINTPLYFFWKFNVPGPALLLTGAMISAAGGYSQRTSYDFDRSELKNTWKSYQPAILGGLLIPTLAIPYGLTYAYFLGLPSILIAIRIKHPFLSFVVSLLLSIIIYSVIIVADLAINGFGIG